jgi:hypothetical protein
MSWPTPQDFVEAVQNPSYAFSDPELRGGVAVETPLGLPKVISGQFACVFKINSGSKTWAVRCFVRNFPDHHLRYSAISKALREAKLPYIVDFDFQSDGVRIKNQWYPIVKMEWISGRLLGDYIAENVAVPSTLLDIQKQIATIHFGLGSRKIAHGDLQHGNIIVARGKLFLIDYDGMFVPDLAGKGSHELGHRHYQHPFRTESDFNERIDTFSVWVLCASLVALSIDPSLWRSLQGGDDSLLLRADDYKNPYKSSAFAALKGHGDHRIRDIALLLESLCYVRALTDLQKFTADKLFVSLQQVPVGGTTTVGGASSTSIPSWLGGNYQGAKNHFEHKSNSSSWIVDYIEFNQESFGAPLRKYRFGVVGLSLSLLFLFAAIGFSSAYFEAFIVGPLTMLAGIFLFLRSGYASDPSCKKRSELKSALAVLSNEVETRKKNIAPKQQQIEAKRGEFAKYLASVEASSLKLGKQLAERQAILSNELSSRKQQAHTKRQIIDSTEASERSAINVRDTGQINTLRNQISTLDQGLQAQLANSLRALQIEYVQDYLKGYSLNQASISGIGEKLTERLIRHGIRTAADATYYAVLQVEGIGDQKAAAIKRWTDGIRQRATNSIPTRLDATKEAQVRSAIEQQKRTIQIAITELERRRETGIAALTTKFDLQRAELGRQLSLVESDYNRKTADANAIRIREDKNLEQQASDATRVFTEWVVNAELDLHSFRGDLAKKEYERSMLERKLEAYRDIKFTRWLLHQLGAG